MHQFNQTTKLTLFIVAVFILPFFAFAVNDVTVSDDTNFSIDTADTATPTIVVASGPGGLVTNFDVQSDYIDITLDNLSTVIFTTTVGGQYLKITKQSGSNDYTLSPTCPTTTVTMTGTGATVVLRLEVNTTNSCTPPPPPPPGGGGGGGGYIPPVPPTPPVATACLPGELFSSLTGAPCKTSSPAPSQFCAPYLTKFIKFGAVNDPAEVTKLQIFLRDWEGETNLSVNGTYDQATFNAVKRFQSKYIQDVLVPWGLTSPTGYVYRTTIFKINELYCGRAGGCQPYLLEFIKLGAVNNPVEVRKLQNFLNQYQGERLPVTGTYGSLDFNAVKRFQSKYIQDILAPWGIYLPTGYVFRTTKYKINELYCAGGDYLTLPSPIELPPYKSSTPTTTSPDDFYQIRLN